MKKNPIEEGRLTDRGRGIGPVTEDRVRQRAGEIAEINGRSQRNILSSDWEQARRELQGKEGLAPTPSKAETIPEEDRWAPEGDSTGNRAPTLEAADEQTVSEKLVEEGIADAEHVQEVEAVRESLKREKRQ
jgi:hypothetical protein